MKRGNYFKSLSPKRKFLIGRNLILVGIFGVFLPLIPGVLCLVIGMFLVYPRLYEITKEAITKSTDEL